MIGAQALVAFQLSNGTMRAYTSQITSYGTNLPEGKLQYDVSNLSATYASGEIIIYATLALPINTDTINQVWQVGPVSSDNPGQHATDSANTNSKGTLNLLSGQSASGGGNSRVRNRNIHGVLCAISWGILMPLGVIIARYLKVFKSADPAWFYLHITCQTSAYIIGLAGWAIGIKLGNQSTSVEYTPHRIIGIFVFVLGTLQVFALLLRPNKDHKFRFHWNIYHRGFGYLVIILAIINIFKGFNILNPDKKWKNAYIGVISVLAINALWLEAYTWYVVLKRRKSISVEKTPQGVNGANGYGAGPTHAV
uniref:Cytochrome b561 domain-containing protein n=1 Tax=Fagus sylvatica TaxID=28930 RepID=A0A2N9EQC4_FAGSY